MYFSLGHKEAHVQTQCDNKIKWNFLVSIDGICADRLQPPNIGELDDFSSPSETRKALPGRLLQVAALKHPLLFQTGSFSVRLLKWQKAIWTP